MCRGCCGHPVFHSLLRFSGKCNFFLMDSGKFQERVVSFLHLKQERSCDHATSLPGPAESGAGRAGPHRLRRPDGGDHLSLPGRHFHRPLRRRRHRGRRGGARRRDRRRLYCPRHRLLRGGTRLHLRRGNGGRRTHRRRGGGPHGGPHHPARHLRRQRHPLRRADRRGSGGGCGGRPVSGGDADLERCGHHLYGGSGSDLLQCL